MSTPANRNALGFVGMLCAVLLASSGAAQTEPTEPVEPTPRPPYQRRVSLKVGLDTTQAAIKAATAGLGGDWKWREPVPEIVRNWITYLQADSAGRAALWSPTERQRWPEYDIAGIMSDVGFPIPATIVSVQPSSVGSTDSYVIKTVYARAGLTRAVDPYFVSRVYAVREDGRWVFANALPRLTRDWPSYTIGKGTFVVQPGRRFDRERATHTVAFVDSLADAYNVPRLRDFTYYVTNSEEDLYRITGLDPLFVGGDGRAGRGWAANRIVISASLKQGEGYTHELVHMVLGQLPKTQRGSVIADEGIATWLGGSMDHDFPSLMYHYAEYLQTHPAVTLDSVVAATDPDRGLRPGAAMLFAMVHAHGGIPAVKALFAAPGRTLPEIQTALTKILGVSWSDVQQSWMKNILAYRKAGAQPPQSPLPVAVP
jgi:hypothetical protein